jgi:hypothetical protein
LARSPHHHRAGIASPVIFYASVSAQKYRDLPQSE